MTDWTIPALKEHFDTRFDALDEAVKERNTNIEERLKGTNEWRQAFDDLTKTMASLTALKAVDDRLKRLEDAEIKSGGGEDRMTRLTAALVQAVATAVAVVGGIKLFSGG